jgi:hypothetical protein
MSFERFFGFVSALAIGGFLTLAETNAQQKQPSEMGDRSATTNENRRIEDQDQMNSSPESSEPKKTTERLTVSGPLKSKENETQATRRDEASEALKPAPPELLPLPKASKLTPLDKAYLDAFSILRQDNECSRFYGGPPAIEVLNRLTRQLKPAYFESSIALKMKGITSVATNYQSGLAYRLFEKAELNLNGPFYRAGIFPNEATKHFVGNFWPNTREARVAILLHEIGHMIKTADNHWVLPDDGDDPELSRQNTLRVIAVCRDQIKGLSRISFAHELSSAQTPVASKPSRVAEVSQLNH